MSSKANHVAGEDDPNQPFRLLDLPPELRSRVYEFHLDDKPQAHLIWLIYQHPQLATTSSLILVSKQVREEFLGIVYLAGPIIYTTARNYDFRHIVTYLNRLDNLELERLTDKDKPYAKEMKIVIGITQNCPSTLPYLDRWVNQAAHPTKKGIEINFQYQVSLESRAYIMTHQPYPSPKGRSKAEWMKVRIAQAEHEIAMQHGEDE